MATQESLAPPSCTFKLQCSRNPSKSSRNLVVCIDGTSNQFSAQNTNIVELYSHIMKSDKQPTYYSSGLGTTAKIPGTSRGDALSNIWDMVAGRNLHKAVMDSYRWLSDNYRDEDRIFLFGFSRGAYQVRALAGMIAQVGLLLPGNDQQIPFAFELYSNTENDYSTNESNRGTTQAELAETFKKTFCRSDVHIHFIGVWDTVSSVGVLKRKTLPCTTTSCEHICYFRHALALDERRVKFLPEYVYGGRTSNGDDERIKEVWFAGCHADVGGGNRRNAKLQSGDIPLLWMRSQAIAAGLKMKPADVMWKVDDLNKQITPSLDFRWWPSEFLPSERLRYHNSDGQTSRPHLGGSRKILPGQKVHVSALFKNNYKPHAHFYDNTQSWPESMFWNDVTSYQRLQDLSDLWEKDLFDEGYVRTLLNILKGGQPNEDALERLASMANSDVYKVVIRSHGDAKPIIAAFLNNRKRVVRLGATAIYCELGWDWPAEMNFSEFRQQVMQDVSELLKDDKSPHHACMYLPSLCKQADMKVGLVSEENMRKLVGLCNDTRIVKGEAAVAFLSARALSMLMKVDTELGQKLIEAHAVTDITVALGSKCNPALVSVLNVMDGLAKYESGRACMKAGPTIFTLLKLVKQFDDFVAPAATRVLCSLFPDDELRDMLRNHGVLSTFLDMLDQCSDETKKVTCQALVKFVRDASGDVRSALPDVYLQQLVERVQSDIPSKRDGAIMALAALWDTQARDVVSEVIRTMQTIRVLVSRLDQKSTALSAASALARLVTIDDVAVVVSDDNTGACMGILNMLRRRWFDGMHGEDGLQVLSELLKCGQLRSAVLKRAIDTLRAMIGNEYESSYAGLHYLWVVAGLDNGRSTLPSDEVLTLIPQIIGALRVPHRRVQHIAEEILLSLSTEDDLRAPIVEGLLGLLENRHPHVLLATSTVLGYLAVEQTVRERVLTEGTFWNLTHEYDDGLALEYDKRGKGPHTAEVHESVGHMIKLMQVAECDNVDPGKTGEKRRPAHMLYEPEKENKAGLFWIPTLFTRLVGAGQCTEVPGAMRVTSITHHGKTQTM